MKAKLKKTPKSRQKQMVPGRNISADALDRLIEKALIDAYGLDEQLGAFMTFIDESMTLPFETKVLSKVVTVTEFEHRSSGDLVAVCKSERSAVRISLRDLPLPKPIPKGGEWILAYRRWVKDS